MTKSSESVLTRLKCMHSIAFRDTPSHSLSTSLFNAMQHIMLMMHMPACVRSSCDHTTRLHSDIPFVWIQCAVSRVQRNTDIV